MTASKVEPGRVEQAHDIESISPDSLVARAVGLWHYLPANGAAFVMQLMHPTIGDVVGKYSVYKTDPYGRAIRSLDSVLLWVYGGAAAVEEGERLRRLHRPLQMTGSDGTHVSALNPVPYGWVIGTAFVVTVNAWPLLFGRRLTDAEQDELYADHKRIARIVQVPEDQIPATRAEYWAYYHRMVRETLVKHPVAIELLDMQREGLGAPPALPRRLRPLWRPVGRAGGRLAYLLTVGPMPDDIRGILEIDWTERDEREMQLAYAALRAAARILPDRLTYAPLAYHAMRQHRSIAAIRRRARPSFVV